MRIKLMVISVIRVLAVFLDKRIKSKIRKQTT